MLSINSSRSDTWNLVPGLTQTYAPLLFADFSLWPLAVKTGHECNSFAELGESLQRITEPEGGLEDIQLHKMW